MSELSTENEMTFERPSSKYENLSSRFFQKDRNFRRQYAHLYAERLCSMYPRLTETAKRKWGNDNKMIIQNAWAYWDDFEPTCDL